LSFSPAAEGLADATLVEILLAVVRLRDARIAHGALGGDSIVVSDRGICVRDFRRASASAPASRLDGDLAAALGAMAVRAGPERTAAAAARVLDADTARAALVHLQRSALDPVTVDALQHRKDLLPRLRAAGAGIEVPKLAEAKRVSWPSLLFAGGSLIGIWLIIGILSDAGDSLHAIKGASWGWVALTFVFAQLPVVAEGWALLGAATGQLPYGRCVALETSNMFTALVGGDVAVFALRVRFFQRQGYDAEAAVSAGAIATTASWTVKTLLFLIAIPFAARSFHAPSGSGGHETAVWIVLAVILAAGIAATLIAVVPRLRRLVSRTVRPHLRNIWANVKTIAAEPRKIVYVLAGSTPGPAAGHLRPWCVAARGRAARQHRDAHHRQHGGRHRRRRRPCAWRARRRRSRPDRRAHQRRHTPGPGHRGRAHPAVLHLLPAPGVGLGDAGLDAPPRIRVTSTATMARAGDGRHERGRAADLRSACA
jgi:hypothetical protein